MDLNFSKKTRKIVASLLAVAILLGVLPVSGLTGNSSGAESSSSENSTKTIYVNSTKQPILCGKKTVRKILIKMPHGPVRL